MVTQHTQQILSITLPTIAIFLSYLWYRRKRIGGQSDPGEISPPTPPGTVVKTLAVELEEVSFVAMESQVEMPIARSLNRSLSGVETSPIDIIIPPKLRSQRTSPVVISDEDLDLQIEKVKQMKSTVEPYSISKATDSFDSPCKQKLSTMKKSPPKEEPKSENEAPPTPERRSFDGDSANHSPVETMRVSCSVGSISDNQSVGSSDSGKGGSDVALPSTEEDVASSLPIVYEFLLPQRLVGKLIGRHGSAICNIKEQSNTKIVARRHPSDSNCKICTIEGTPQEVDKALHLIRNKFPIRKFPEVTLEQVTIVADPVELAKPDTLYLKLVECFNNDTTICSVVTPHRLFVQLPTHPAFLYLQRVSTSMNNCYNNNKMGAPTLPTPIPDNTICVAYFGGEWYRAMVLFSHAESEMSRVTLLDVGGYYDIENKNLKQIRGDMLLLPFQAIECCLHNLKPVGDEWSEEALRFVSDLGRGRPALTQIASYTETGIPEVLMFIIKGPTTVVNLREELVKKGFAELIVPETTSS